MASASCSSVSDGSIRRWCPSVRFAAHLGGGREHDGAVDLLAECKQAGGLAASSHERHELVRAQFESRSELVERYRFSHVNTASTTPPPMASALSDICVHADGSHRGSTSPIFSPAVSATRSEIKPRITPVKGASIERSPTCPRSLTVLDEIADRNVPVRPCHRSAPAGHVPHPGRRRYPASRCRPPPAPTRGRVRDGARVVFRSPRGNPGRRRNPGRAR